MQANYPGEDVPTLVAKIPILHVYGQLGGARRASPKSRILTIVRSENSICAADDSVRVVSARSSCASRVGRSYCFSYTEVTFRAWPCAFVPVWVTVRVLPSAETMAFAAMVTFPFNLVVASRWFASIRL